MISDQLGHIIHEQICQNPLVVLPGFGGFVMETVPAELDELRNRIKPPSKTAFFNGKLVHNDGMLISALAQRHEIGYAEADDLLTDSISELRFRLEQGDKVVWDGLGTLSKNLTGQVEFIFNGDAGLQADMFGLKPLSLQVVEKDNVDKVRELVSADGPVITSVRTLPFKKVARYAAAAVAVGFLMWIPFQKGIVDNGHRLAHQLNPFHVSTESVYGPRTFNDNWINKGFEKEDALAKRFEQAHVSLFLTENATDPIVVSTGAVLSEEVAVDESPESEVEETASSYKVIAATFKTKAEATDHVAKMIKRGFGAEYAGMENHQHLVAYGTYSSKEDAQNMLASVSLSNKEARIVSGS